MLANIMQNDLLRVQDALNRFVPPNPGDVKLRVSDATGRPVEGVSYSIFRHDTDAITSRSDNLGIVTFTGVEPDFYWLAESETIPGYARDFSQHSLLVSQDLAYTIDAYNPDEAFLIAKPEYYVDFTIAAYGDSNTKMTLILADTDITYKSAFKEAGCFEFCAVVPGEYEIKLGNERTGLTVGIDGSVKSYSDKSKVAIVTSNKVETPRNGGIITFPSPCEFLSKVRNEIFDILHAKKYV